MVTKKQLATTTVAAFGAAAASAYLAPEMQADILDITWNGGNPTATAPFSSGTANVVTQDIDQVMGGGTLPRDFRQYNDQFGTDAVGRSMFGCQSTYGELPVIQRATSGQVIDAGTFPFSGYCNIGAGTATTFVGTGTWFVAFRSAAGNVGWFKVETVSQGAITYSDGQYGSMGESVTVGETTKGCDFEIGDVNQDGLVSLLDVDPFTQLLIKGNFQCEADVNEDGLVNLEDVDPFVVLLSGG